MSVRNGCPRPGSCRQFWGSNASLADILCAPPYAVRVWVVFFDKMGFSFETVRLFFRLRHLSSESAIFHDFRKKEKKNHFESRFAVVLKISVFALGVSQKSKFGLSLGF